MIGVLDEAANVCRWKDLPDLSATTGVAGSCSSRSCSPGPKSSDAGANAEWRNSGPPRTGASTAAASTTPPFLDRLTKIIGDKELLRSSTSTSKQGTSVNRQLQREQILDVAELAALPAR